MFPFPFDGMAAPHNFNGNLPNLIFFQSGSLRKAPKVASHFSYTLFVSLRNFVCKISEETELLIALYDAKEGKVFSENYVVRWNKDSLKKDIDQLHNLRVLFTVCI